MATTEGGGKEPSILRGQRIEAGAALVTDDAATAQAVELYTQIKSVWVNLGAH